jgi:antitoxin component YwqK of YwqJK toxin-antitoxin module
MRLYFLITILLIIHSGCSSNYSSIVESYPNGMKKIEFLYKKENDIKNNILINGQKLLYDSLGNLAQKDDYLGGKLNGEEVWYYPNANIWMITKVRNDSAYGFEYEFSQTGDTLKANVHYGLSVDGVFYKKWLPNQLTLTGSYGDSDRTHVIWRWFEKNGREVKSKVDSGISVNNEFKQFIAPE